jgi:hypothetical protein
LLATLVWKTASASPKVILPPATLLRLLGFLLLDLFKVGQAEFGNGKDRGFKTATNELALHAKSGKINLRRLVTNQVCERRFCQTKSGPEGSSFAFTAAVSDFSIRLSNGNAKKLTK